MAHLVLGLLIATASLSHSASDCVCIRDSNATLDQLRAQRLARFKKAEAVFLGRVVYVDAYKVRFEVQQLWKGTAEMVLDTGVKIGFDGTPLYINCEYRFELNEEYLVYANNSDGKVVADPCNTLRASGANPEELELDAIRSHRTVHRKRTN